MTLRERGDVCLRQKGNVRWEEKKPQEVTNPGNSTPPQKKQWRTLLYTLVKEALKRFWKKEFFIFEPHKHFPHFGFSQGFSSKEYIYSNLYIEYIYIQTEYLAANVVVFWLILQSCALFERTAVRQKPISVRAINRGPELCQIHKSQTLPKAIQTQALTALTKSPIWKIMQPLSQDTITPHMANPIVRNLGN